MEQAANYIMNGLAVIFVLAVPLAIFGLRWREGFWSNTVCFSNITFASLIAINFFEPVASLLASAYVGGMFFYDFLAFWLLFVLTFGILNLMTNRLSKVKVHFPLTMERIGNVILLLSLFSNFVSVISFSFPMVPKQPPDDALKGAEIRSVESFGGKVRYLSQGSLAPFAYKKPWIESEKYITEQTNKRWAVYDSSATKNTFLYDGSPPPTANR